MSRKSAFLKISLIVTLAAGLFVASGCELLMGYTTPEWTSVAKSRDGREFVTDGRIAIDVAYARVEELPEVESSASWFSDALYRNSLAERRVLFSGRDIKPSEGNPEILIGPAGLQLEESYVSYIQHKFSTSHNIAYWQQSPTQPVVIVFDGSIAVGAMKVPGQR